MLESPNQCHLKGKGMRMDKFNSVFTNDLQLHAGGHSANSHISSVYSMRRSQLMDLGDSTPHRSLNECQSIGKGQRMNKFVAVFTHDR